MGHYRSEMMTPDEVEADNNERKTLKSAQDRGWLTYKVGECWTCPVCGSWVSTQFTDVHEPLHTKKQWEAAAKKKRDEDEAYRQAYKDRLKKK